MSLTLTAPTIRQAYQYNLETEAAEITITGTATENMVDVQASYDGENWVSIDTTADLAFSGTLTVPIGQWTISVREGTGATEDTVTLISVTDILIVRGQSNASGRGDNNQSYSAPSFNSNMEAIMFHNDLTWDELADPTDSNTGQVYSIDSDSGAAGSPWPLLATLFMEEYGRPFVMTHNSRGGYEIDYFTDFTAANAYMHHNLGTRLTAMGSGSPAARLCLWYQGESDAQEGATATYYRDELITMADRVYTDYGIPTMPALIHRNTAIAGGGTAEAAINEGIRQAAITRPDVIILGPDCSDMQDDGDGWHFTENATLQEFANRWFQAIQTYINNRPMSGGPIYEYSPGLQAELRLARITDLDLTSTGATELFTGPAGRQFVITRIVLRVTSVSGTPTNPTIEAGQASGYDDWRTAGSVSGLDTALENLELSSDTPRRTYQAGESIHLNVTSASGATTHLVDVDVFGYLV